MRALGRAKKLRGEKVTCASFGGARSVRWGEKRGRLVWSARPKTYLPTLKKRVNISGRRVVTRMWHWWARFSMFPPQGAAQSAPREAAARKRPDDPPGGGFQPPTPKNFFCTKTLQVVYGFFSVSDTFLSDSIFLSTPI